MATYDDLVKGKLCEVTLKAIMCCWVKSPSLVSLYIIFRTFQEIDNYENASAGDKGKTGDADQVTMQS